MSISVTPEQRELLEREAKTKGTSVSAVLREMTYQCLRPENLKPDGSPGGYIPATPAARRIAIGILTGTAIGMLTLAAHTFLHLL